MYVPVTQFHMLVGFDGNVCQAHFCMDKNVNQFEKYFHCAGTNHTHHPTDVSHLEDMVGGMTLERVSGSQSVGVNNKKRTTRWDMLLAQYQVFMAVNKPSGMFITTTAQVGRNLVNKPQTSSSCGLSLFTVINTRYCAMTRGNIHYRNSLR